MSDTNINDAIFINQSNKMLEELYSYLDALAEKHPIEIDFDNGVLSFCLEKQNANFVINSNFASKKIWYSSPVSKPKYYQFCQQTNNWLESTLKTNIKNDLKTDLQKLLNF